MRYLRGVAGLAMTAGLGGCDGLKNLVPFGCHDDVAALSLSVLVVDSISNVSLVNGATVFAQDGTFSDSVTVFGDSSLMFSPRIPFVSERPGTYAIRVTHADYRDWTTSGVRVVKDGCHVRTTLVDARLVRAP